MMRPLHLISILATAILGLIPLTSFADAKIDAEFQTACVKAWMDRMESTSDKVEFKNFGEKYCGCAAGKDLSTSAALEKSAQLCMSQVLLRDTIDSLEEDEGLNNLTQDKIQTACQDKWKMIYGKNMSDDMTKNTMTYCQCAAPQLMELTKNKDNLTDKDWYDKSDSIAAECADKVQADKDTTNIKSKK